jgi:hypothetical protein
MKRSLGILALCLLGLCPVCVAEAATSHHDGAKKIQGKGDGKHPVLHTKHGHVATAHVRDGKITKVTVRHKGKSLPVKKFSTTKKLHAQADFSTGVQYAMLDSRAVVNVLTPATVTDAPSMRGGFGQANMFIGFGFFNQFTNQWEIVWFPANMVMGGASGATPFPGGGNPGPGGGGFPGPGGGGFPGPGGGGFPGPGGGGNPAPQGTTILNENGSVQPLGTGAAATKLYFVQLQSGATYTITVTATSAGYFPEWLLFQTPPVGTTLVKMATAGGGNRAQAVVSVNTAGLYKITVVNDSVNNPGGSGNFNITVVQN